MFSKILLSVTMFAACAQSYPADAAEFKPENTIIIDQPIMNQTMQPVSNQVMAWIVAPKKLDSVNMIINSPGGSVTTGFFFISKLKALKAQGTVLNCYVVNLAASMAFHFLTQCDSVTVLDESGLLWHRARVNVGGLGGEPMTAPQASDLARDLSIIDDHIFTDVLAAVKGMPVADISYHFEKETLHFGRDLCKQTTFCVSKPHVPGLLEAMVDKKLVRTGKEQGFFDMLTGEIMYVWSGFRPVIAQ